MNDFTAGCGFFSTADLEAWIEGKLSPERREELDRHVESPCAECLTLAADLDTFRQLIVGGVIDAERQAGESLAEPLRALLLQAVRKRRRSG